MGVKDLWGLVSPIGEVLPFTELEGTTVAIDLAPWVVDSQNVNMGKVTRPHLRNLLWRTLRLLNAGVLPLFVLEGDAPSLKWDTINKRNQQNFGHGKEPAAATVKTGNRSQFKRVQKECANLLDLLGVPWVQASGEAEATCAALNYHKVVSGVITQDSDVFLYGGETVFRNFTANQSKATVEKFCMAGIVEHLGVNRSGLLVLSILLGCDYLPAGIPGVGKETAIRMIREWYQQGITDSLDRICKWSLEDEDDWRDFNPKKWKTGSLLELEAGVRSRALATNGFPFLDIIKEFKTNIRIPARNFKWKQPQMKELMRWCIIKLDWEPDYALDKVAPVVSRWIMVNISPQKPLPTNYVPEMQAVRCVKKCVRGGVASMAVEWHVVDNEKFQCSIPAYVTTDEPVVFISESAPQLIEQFEAELKAKKKGKSSRKKKSEEVLDHGIASMNLNTKVESKKTTRRKVVKSNTKVKPITDYLQPKNKIEDIVKEHKEEFKSEENIENSKKKNHPLCLQDRATLRQKENITKKENHVIQTDVKTKEISSSKNVKNKEISLSKNVEKLSVKEISINELYDMQSLNDDDLAELSGMLRKLEMVDECQNNHILNSKEEEQYITECESHTNDSQTNKGCNFDLTLGNEESLNDDFDKSRNINNISEIINRMSEAPISLIDKNKGLNLIKTHLNENASNSNNQMQQKDEKSNFNSIISREETYQNNDNNSNPYDPICNKNEIFIEERISKSINISKTMKPTLSSLKDDVNCKKNENYDSEESLKNISSDNLNRTNLSSDHSNYTEESWQDDDDNDFELSMIINRITGLRMENDNSCTSKNTKAINPVKGFKILKSDEERNNVSDNDISVSLKIKSKTKINAKEFMKTDLKKLETQTKRESDLKKSSCWDYFTPISERQDNMIPLPRDKILSSQPKYNTYALDHTGNSVCNKIETDIPKEIEKHSQENLIASLKHQASSKMAHAGNMATDIIRSSLKNSSELSTFGNSLSDSILAAATADSMIFDKTENSKNQVSFDLFEDSCDSQVNKKTTKFSSNYKSENSNKGTTLNLPKHHSTPSVDCIAPRRILNQKTHTNTPSLVKNSQGNDFKLPSPVFVSSPAQTSFISDFGSPFPTLSPLNNLVKESFPCTNKGFDTPISSKINRNQISNHTTSKTDSDLYVSSSDDHQERSSKVCTKKYECKSSDKPKYKVREDQLCFKLFDNISNSGLNISTSLSKIQKDSPSSAELKENRVPKWAPSDCDAMSILFPNKCLGNAKLEVVPEENVSSINDKEERKPLTGLMETESNVNVLHNNRRRVIEGKSPVEKLDLQKKNSKINKFMNLKSSDINEDNSLHIKKGKENKESNLNYNTENETNINSFSKYRDVSTFSPVVLSQYVSLADRLKAKCTDKAMEKLIDQL